MPCVRLEVHLFLAGLADLPTRPLRYDGGAKGRRAESQAGADFTKDRGLPLMLDTVIQNRMNSATETARVSLAELLSDEFIAQETPVASLAALSEATGVPILQAQSWRDIFSSEALRLYITQQTRFRNVDAFVQAAGAFWMKSPTKVTH